MGAPVEAKKAPHPLAVMDKEAKSPFVGDVWKKVRFDICRLCLGFPVVASDNR